LKQIFEEETFSLSLKQETLKQKLYFSERFYELPFRVFALNVPQIQWQQKIGVNDIETPLSSINLI